MMPWPGLSARVITAVLWRLSEALHGNNDLSLSVSFSQIPESVGDIAQLIAPVDGRCHLSALEKFPHDLHVLSVRLCLEEDDLLAATQRSQAYPDDVAQRPEQAGCPSVRRR